MKRNRKPKRTRYAAWFLLRISSFTDHHSLLDDLEIEYGDLAAERGRVLAFFWYVQQMIRAMPELILLALSWRFSMFNNYFKMTIRNLQRHKGYSFINIAGLVIGMTCFVLIMLYIRYELSYDAFYANADRIYRVIGHPPEEIGSDALAITPAPFASAIMETIPEVDHATKFNAIDRLLLTKEETSFYEYGLFADEHFFDIFSFKFLKGDKAHIQDNPESIVISLRLANKFFGNEDPMGRTLQCSLGDFSVAGITEDVPENSHIQYDWIIPFSKQFRPEDRERRLNAWNWDSYYTYVVLRDASQKQVFEDKFNTLTKKRYREGEWEARTRIRYDLQSLKRIHLTSGLRYELSVTTDMIKIRLFFCIAICILLIACINAMNLSTARASTRAKEIGIRKVVGAQRLELFRQFTGESLCISALAFIFALGLVVLLLPWFNQFVQRSIALDALDNRLIFGLLGVVIMTGLISGMYPALFLSAFKPVSVLKQKHGDHKKGGNLRNILVLFQFSITIVLMIASLVIFSQINYIKNRDIGFNREQILVLRRTDPGIRENFTGFKNDLLANPMVMDVTTSSQLPINIGSATGVRFNKDDGEEKLVHYQWIGADYNFIDVFGMDIVQGRNFSREFGADAQGAIIINEKFVNEIGWSNPIGKRLPVLWDGSGENVVVGVVKDFHARSMHSLIKPLVIGCRPNSYFVHIRFQSENIQDLLVHLENSYDRFKVRYPFEYFFMDEQFNQMYQSEQKLGEMLVYFSGLAIFIACLGIFGLAAHTAARRTKEIGIRKVLGASVPGVMILFSRSFTRWVLISNALAWPIAYFMMRRWLQSFTYRVNMGLWVFVLSALLAFCIALLTVSYQSVKAATANPVDSLKYE